MQNKPDIHVWPILHSVSVCKLRLIVLPSTDGLYRARQLHAISEFGSLYGLLFQITDDILDVEGDFTAMGKTLGKDKEAHKLTYVNLYGLETAKQMAEETAQKARNAVACFGSGANYLTELVDITLERKH